MFSPRGWPDDIEEVMGKNWFKNLCKEQLENVKKCKTCMKVKIIDKKSGLSLDACHFCMYGNGDLNLYIYKESNNEDNCKY